MSMFRQWYDPKMVKNVMKAAGIDAIVGSSERKRLFVQKPSTAPVCKLTISRNQETQ